MVEITLNSRAILRNGPEGLKDEIVSKLTFENPKWLENVKMNRWNGNTQHYFRYCLSPDLDTLIFPRGFTPQVIGMCKRYGITPKIIDKRRSLEPVKFEFTGTPRDFQKEATTAMLKKDFGTLSAPTGSGKTVMGLHLITERKQPALILVHTKELLEQWIERIEAFLGIPREEIGVIGNGKRILGQKVTVATVQTLGKIADQCSPHIGHLIIDECHHTPSTTFTDVITCFDCRYMLGLSATPWRRDGLSRLIFWHVGDVVHQIDKAGLVASGNVLPFEVVTKETRFITSYDASAEYSRMLSELTEDSERNRLIADTVASDSGPGISLLLSDRKTHCEELQGLLRRRGVYAETLTGDRTPKQRKNIVERLNKGEIGTLIATGQLIGEGFDCPALSTLYVCTPIKFEGRLIQYIGRVLRPTTDKSKARVIDFIDSRVGVLKAAARARQRVYESASA